MNNEKLSTADVTLWENCVNAYFAYIAARMLLFSHSSSIVESVRIALRNPTQRTIALEIAEILKAEQMQRLFDSLLELASFDDSSIARVRKLILALPSDWLKANIETHAERVLANGTYVEYRRLLELYCEIDLDLTWRLAQRALQSADEDVREAGEDFTEKVRLQRQEVKRNELARNS